MIVTPDPLFWEDKYLHPVLERVGAAPAEVVAYIAMVNAACGIDAVTTADAVPADMLADLRSAMAEVPAVVGARLEQILLGVYFARGVGSSAITDVVVDQMGAILGAVVVLDLDAFTDRSANAWATWKESTPFDTTVSTYLEVTIAEPHQDTRANAIQFLLLHEYGHVLSTGQRFLPIWWLGADAIKTTADYAFLRLAWDIGADKTILPKAGQDFAGRASISYYAATRLSAEAMLAIYEGLQPTGFPTLYAATNAFDDFAECFATYVHGVLLNKPLRVRVYRNGALHLERDHFWDSAAGAAKRAFMEAMLPGD